MDITLNQNSAECIKSAAGLLGTTYTNICTGVTTAVPYGAVDLLGGMAIGLVLLAVVGMLGTLIYAMIHTVMTD